jgi:CheY-like chemotaxis protein
MRIPIIALTAHAMQSDIQMCLDAGMDDYVSKPIARSDLWRALGRVGRRETQLHPTPSSGDDSHLVTAGREPPV